MSNFEKYIQEIEEIVRKTAEMHHGSYQGQYSLSKLKELVGRATPMKRIEPHKKNGEWELSFTCNCGKSLDRLNEFNFCPNCGQAIDWGDQDE